MVPVISSMAEAAPAAMRVASIVHSSNGPAVQNTVVTTDPGARVENAQNMPETQCTDLQRPVVLKAPNVEGEQQMVSRVTSGSSQTPDGDSGTNVSCMTQCGNRHQEKRIAIRLPTSRAAAAAPVMAERTNEEILQLSRVAEDVASFDAGSMASVKTEETSQAKTIAPVVMSRRHSRAAAAVASTAIARQAKQEVGLLEMLISSAMDLGDRDVDMEIPRGTKKKRTTKGSGRALKRSRVTTSRLLQNTLEMENADQNWSRDNKRRQATTYDAALAEASPIITDIPPLPFTSTSPELRSIGKNKSMSKQIAKSKTKLTHVVQEMISYDDRNCEYCKKVANICVLMHCRACCRVYHAQCLVHAFKPYVDGSIPIFDQMEQLQLKAPEHRGNIFCCASCKAAFLDFYDSGGYMWDCSCPTCTQPEKIVFYRQRKLVQMMNAMELEKQRKKEQKGQKKNGTFVSGKPPVSTPSRSNSQVTQSANTRR